MNLNDLFNEEKVRLDPKCWTGKKIGNPKTKVKGGVRVNNCVPAESVAEGQLEANTPDPVVVVQDLKGNILDKINLSVAAQKYKLGQPQNIKNQLAHQNYTKVGNYTIVSPMSGQPQDATTQGVAETELDEKSVSQAQFRTMAGAAHNPEFARKVGISQDVAQEFNQADKHSNYKKLPDRATEGSLEEIDRRGFLKGLGAAAVAGAAGGVATKADAQEVTQWTKYATDLATRTMGRIHQDTGYDLRNWLVTNVGNWVSDYCRQTNSYNAKNVIDTCNQQAYEASGLDKENKLVSAFLTNMKNRYQDFLNAYRAGISEAYQKYNSALQSQQQQKSAMGNLGKEEFDVLIDALIVYAICKDRQLDNSDLFKAVAASIKRFIDANNAKDYVNSIYPKAKQSVEVLKNNPELYQKESAQFFRNADSTIEKLDRLSSNKKPEFESVEQGVAEGEQKKGADYRDPKEVDYDGEYDAMVSRVKKLAGLGPMKTTYDPAKRQYRNMPTAQQPKK